jgi:hypothetical protein
MKTLLTILTLIVFASLAEAQQTCAKVSSTSQNCTVTVSWTPGVGGTAPTSFIVQKRIGTNPFTDLKSVAATVTTTQIVFPDTGNVRNDFVVVALAGTDRSGPSNIASWTTPPIALSPGAPTNTTLSSLSRDSIRAAWQTNCADCTAQEVSLNQGHPWKNFTIPVSATAGNYTANGLRRDTQYTVRIRAMRGDTVSDYSAPVSVVTLK